MTTTSESPLDLRARRRRQTLREVHEIAVRLIDERGFDATTVDDIAAAAGISQRTFFRYFPAKEDAVLLPHREFEELIDEYTPPDDAPMTVDAVDALYESQIDFLLRTSPETSLAVQRIIEHEPKLRDAALARECAISRRLFERFQILYPDADELTIRVPLEVAAAIYRAARQSWRAGDDLSASELQRRYRAARARLGLLSTPG